MLSPALRKLLPLLGTLALGACATAAPDAAWRPRADADLAADKAACNLAANEVDPRSAKEYTDGRYGVAAALAQRIDSQSDRGGTVERMREAVFNDCMVRKGWTPK